MDKNNTQIKELRTEIHECLLRKTQRNKTVKDYILRENRIFALLCDEYDMSPAICARKMEERYADDISVDEVIQLYRRWNISHPAARNEIYTWAENTAGYFELAMTGDEKEYRNFEEARKQPALRNNKKHRLQERILAIMLYVRYPDLAMEDDFEKLLSLENTWAKYFLYDIADAVGNKYGYVEEQQKRYDNKMKKVAQKIQYDQALRKIERLEQSLERTNLMLQELQDEFEEQLEESQVKEMTDFFTKLNSEKYGRILDELLVIRQGMGQLKRKRVEIPIEINGLLIMVKRLTQFVMDAKINPIMKVGSIQEVQASDIEFCDYDGSPFHDDKEKKKVKVISPGWVYEEKEIQISRPKVREEEE